MEIMNVSHNYDNELNKIIEKGLKWLPWVGKEYSSLSADKKLLIIGESHYYPDMEKKETYENDKKTTQYCIWESGIKKEWLNKTLDNIARALVKDNNTIGSNLWNYVSYYNFCQQAVNTVKERPTSQNFIAGYPVFINILKVLKPSYCLFIGSQALKIVDHNNGNNLNIEAEKIGRYYGRKTDLIIDNQKYHLISIKHAGKYFTWKQWNRYLCRHLGEIPDFLLENIIKGK